LGKNMDTSPIEAPKRPWIFAYSLIVPAIWIGVSVTLSVLAPGKRAGSVGSALILMGAASLVGWLFSKRHHRHLSSSEFWRIVIYSFVWVLLLEALALFALLVQPSAQQMTPQAIATVVAITVPIDAVFVWLAFRVTGRRVITACLEKERS
jgi:hypothetical protein